MKIFFKKKKSNRDNKCPCQSRSFATHTQQNQFDQRHSIQWAKENQKHSIRTQKKKTTIINNTQQKNEKHIQKHQFG